MTPSKDLMKPGEISNINSTPMLNIHLGKLLPIKSQDIFTTLMEVMHFSTSPLHHSEGKLKITTSLSLNPFGTGTPKMVKSAGTQAASLLLTPTIPSADISIRLTASSEANVKEETLTSNKDGLWSKFKR